MSPDFEYLLVANQRTTFERVDLFYGKHTAYGMDASQSPLSKHVAWLRKIRNYQFIGSMRDLKNNRVKEESFHPGHEVLTESSAKLILLHKCGKGQ